MRHNPKGLLTKNVTTTAIDEELNRLGREGWELVNGIPVTGGSYMTKTLVLLLKRKTRGE
ncbi:DUF4177 domain-containing protein [Arthrobacter castelli]|uniref:DUF4177 domain-containing protein n=1 Tax=Arthrobacter castelli TaxID=271431 RepID=UPI0009D6CCF7